MTKPIYDIIETGIIQFTTSMFIMAIVFIIILIFSVILHEISHGYVADHLGDPTARLSGRLTLNPLPHIDLFGSIILPLFLILSHAGFLFGWAKPVPFDPFNLKNPRRDAALISVAGPITNLLIAVISSIVLRLFILFNLPVFITIGSFILVPAIQLNIMLAVFNLLPIAPLDGFKIIGGILPQEQSRQWYGLERYGIIFLLLLLINSAMLNTILGPVINFLLNLLVPTSSLGII